MMILRSKVKEMVVGNRDCAGPGAGDYFAGGSFASVCGVAGDAGASILASGVPSALSCQSRK